MKATASKPEQRKVIRAVTLGNLLEWFDIYSYSYLSVTLEKVFFGPKSSTSDLINIYAIFALAFVIRPFSSIIFGRIGDLIGRKTAFFWSVIIITLPTFIMGCLPTYSLVGGFAPMLLILLRCLQAAPAAGEVPGSMCFLYEFSNMNNQKFMASWSGVGNQIGAIIAVVETVLLDGLTSHEFMLQWGWRISFWSAGIFGILGVYLRHHLFETPFFQRAEKTHRLDAERFWNTIVRHKRQILLGTCFGAVSASTFYASATYFPTYLGPALGLTFYQVVFINVSLLILSTALLPLLGLIGDRFDFSKILIFAILIIVISIALLETAVKSLNIPLLATIGIAFVVSTSCVTAYIGFILARLFPVPVRFTGVGLSFNLADGFIGGFTPVICLFLYKLTGDELSFQWFIYATALISFIALMRIRRHPALLQ